MKTKVTEFRHQTKNDADMMAIYSTIKKEDILRAIRGFWLSFAYERKGEFDAEALMAFALESVEILEEQALLIRQRFGLDTEPMAQYLDLDETEIDSEDEQPARVSLLFDDDDEWD